MTCPVCFGYTKVIDSRKRIDHVLRQRKCILCGYTFNTIETDEDLYQRLEKGKNHNHDTNEN